MNNEQVVKAWSVGREARGGNMISTGSRLFSYALEIGGTIAGKRIVGDFTAQGQAFYSMTTSHHVSKAKGYADCIVSADEFRSLVA